MEVAFSPDGQTIVSGSDDRTIKLWDASTGHIFNINFGGLKPVVDCHLMVNTLVLARAALALTARMDVTKNYALSIRK